MTDRSRVPSAVGSHRSLLVHLLLAAGGLLLIATTARAQLITMSKECRADLSNATVMREAGNFGGAIELLDEMGERCDTRDAREQIPVEQARAYNGLGQFENAIAAAEAALEVTEGESINALFEKAVAEEGLGNPAAAEQSYDRIIALTENNENVVERATIHAKVANLNYRAGNRAKADSYLEQAMALDPDNPDYYVQRGDWFVNDGDYERGFESYDRAAAMGLGDAERYALRAEASIGMMQRKYGTENVQELRSRMTESDRDLVCAELRKALDLGLRDMQLDMFSALVCR
jgi:tetratricopeptide (TPR) repeat protein